MDGSRVVLLLPINLLLFWAVSPLGAVVSKYVNALKVAESSSRFPRAAYVGHKCIGTTKHPKNVLDYHTNTNNFFGEC